MKINFFFNIFIWLLLITLPETAFSQSTGFTIQDVKFESQGTTLAGSILEPEKPLAAVIIVHGSDPVKEKWNLQNVLLKKVLPC